jgi:hypothetical protein
MNPFRNDPHPDLTAAIRAVAESHSRAQLEKMTTTQLRELQKKYAAAVVKGDRKAAEELATVRGLLRAKGAGSVVDEGVNANMERLKAANAEDLKDKPGAAGKAAHKRLHKTIGKVLKSK